MSTRSCEVYDAIHESVLRAIGRGVEATFGEIARGVQNDYGRVTHRSVSRHLADAVAAGELKRVGIPGHFLYSRAPALRW